MILVLGATGFLGKTVCKKLAERGLDYYPTSLSLGVDLRDESKTLKLFKKVNPKVVINCASYVGGIQFGYKHPTELFSNNLKMVTSILNANHEAKVGKFINPISNCVYPSKSTYFKESEIWDGEMHESVSVYGFVRKAFIIGANAYEKQYNDKIFNIVLSNMYGPGDHFEEERSHALGALIMKFVKAKLNNEPKVVVWGTGTPVREWLHIEDGAESLIRAIDIPFFSGPVNIGVGNGISVKDTALLLKRLIDYTGVIEFDHSKPDGAPYKTVDGSLGEKLMNWRPQKNFELGVQDTIEWYLKNKIEL
ncbi:MAG: GDP-L-fucose synthetase [Bacteroidetes bacterium GWE2_39_28]|nr:MAG: GDP-L-fucose synthetase [Bacteroidetes bacterium GWE2_39_28]OFY13357.1 MAG: GDP-L-fucose synthetase [Bacteroidetes bacterium GWF2_39_10]HCT94549.1 GDP-L-fucose synthetase [Rikenellaceae bacterium]